ncbi:MAG: hypothetical protein ACI8P9_005787 [Parasphingorhabdus sp.]
MSHPKALLRHGQIYWGESRNTLSILETAVSILAMDKRIIQFL